MAALCDIRVWVSGLPIAAGDPDTKTATELAVAMVLVLLCVLNVGGYEACSGKGPFGRLLRPYTEHKRRVVLYAANALLWTIVWTALYVLSRWIVVAEISFASSLFSFETYEEIDGKSGEFLVWVGIFGLANAFVAGPWIVASVASRERSIRVGEVLCLCASMCVGTYLFFQMSRPFLPFLLGIETVP